MVGKVLRYFQVLSLFLFCKQLFDEDYVLNVIFIMGGISVISRGLFLFCLTVCLASARAMQLLLFARSQPSSGGRFTGMSFFFRFTSGSKKLSFWTNCAYYHGDGAALAFCRSSRKLSFCSVGVLRMRGAFVLGGARVLPAARSRGHRRVRVRMLAAGRHGPRAAAGLPTWASPWRPSA